MILHYSDSYDFREVFQKVVSKVLKHVCSSRKQVVPYCTAVLRECSVKGEQVTWQIDFSLGFSSDLFHGHNLFCLLFIKVVFNTKCNRSNIHYIQQNANSLSLLLPW